MIEGSDLGIGWRAENLLLAKNGRIMNVTAIPY